MSKRKSWTKQHSKLLIDIMLKEALFPEQVFKKYPDKFPVDRTYYRYLAKTPEFKQEVVEARGHVFGKLHAELQELSLMSDKEAFIHYGKAQPHEIDDIDYKEASNFRVYRIRQIQFDLAKMAPVLTQEYNQKLQVEHSGQTTNQFEFLLADFTKALPQGKVIDQEE